MSSTSRKIETTESQVNRGSKTFESAIIPKSFWLGGIQVDVIYDENLYKNKKIVGEARYPSQSIVIDTTILKKESCEQSYYHELTHWILYMMNENELRCNEKFVDVFSHFLYQSRVTEQREANIEQNQETASLNTFSQKNAHCTIRKKPITPLSHSLTNPVSAPSKKNLSLPPQFYFC